MNDPIGDLLTRIRNAQAARKHECSAPWSRLKEDLCRLLEKEGWIASMELTGEDPKKGITVHFAPDKILELSRVSKPGRRVYTGSADLRPVKHGLGIAVLTTSEGLMTDRDARKKKIGGEVLCTIS